jgi:hypothetical protein
LKAAQIATLEPIPDPEKRIHQRHFIQGMEEVIAAQAVMSQSLFDEPIPGGLDRLTETREELQGELALMAERFEGLERTIRKLAGEQSATRGELETRQTQFLDTFSADRRRRDRAMYLLVAGVLLLALVALVLPWVKS